ncbi:MAG: NADH-quinone oxidoreductase subunit N [Gemmatimonadales bacterium]
MNTMAIDLTNPLGMALSLLPEIVLTAWALVLMLVAAWRHGDDRAQRLVGNLTVGALASGLLALWWLWSAGAEPAGLPLMIALDPFRWMSGTIMLLGAMGAVLLSLGYLGREQIWLPEYYVLLLFATIGMLLMGGAADLLVIFLGLETMSVAVYVLAGIKRNSPYSAEAALKYFLLGAFASGFLLYGIALVYGATGTTNLTGIALQLATSHLIADRAPMLVIGIGMLLIGFGFKVAAVPFHMWTPDVYDGAPTPITGFMAAAVKAAGFAAFVRVFVTAFGEAGEIWQGAVWVLAAITMIVGNLVALSQRKLKRMLAYSSIGHAGYLLVAVVAGTPAGASAFLFYALAYTLMTVGSFGMLGALGEDGERDVEIDDLAGLAKRRPWLAFAMAVFMLALLGFPGTAGFIGKWTILVAAVGAGQATLAVILVLASVVSAGYYLPVIMAMYMKQAETPRQHAVADRAVLGNAARGVLAVAAILTLLFGVWPNKALDAARDGGNAVGATRGLFITQRP